MFTSCEKKLKIAGNRCGIPASVGNIGIGKKITPVNGRC